MCLQSVNSNLIHNVCINIFQFSLYSFREKLSVLKFHNKNKKLISISLRKIQKYHKLLKSKKINDYFRIYFHLNKGSSVTNFNQSIFHSGKKPFILNVINLTLCPLDTIIIDEKYLLFYLCIEQTPN